jgi:putative flippase GtrA
MVEFVQFAKDVDDAARGIALPGKRKLMGNRSSSAIVIGIATFVAVLVVSLLLSVNVWFAIIIAAICAFVAQFVTARQGRS